MGVRHILVTLVGCPVALFAAGVGPVEAQAPALPPVANVSGGTTDIDDIGLYSVSYRYFDGRSGALPLGWTGLFENATGVSCEAYGTQDGKKAFLLVPPWRGGGTGVIDQTFHLALPKASRITLQFAIAMKTGMTAPGKSDGATFRVFLDDKTLLDENKTDAAWASHEIDLTPYAGRTVTLRFETDPGPQHNAAYDYALWGDRKIVVSGAAQSARHARRFSVSDYAAAQMKAVWGGAAPTCPPASEKDVPLQTRLQRGSTDFLGGWTAVSAQSAPAPPVSLGLANGAYLDLMAPDGHLVKSNAPEVHVTVEEQPIAGKDAVRRRLRYQIGARTVTVETDLYAMRDGSARVDVRSDDPYIAAVHFGDIGPVAVRKPVVVPYLGTVSYLPELDLFTNVIPDYTRSQASSLDGTTAIYDPLSDGRRNPVRETAYYAVSPDVRAVLPTAPNPPSPYRRLLGDQVVMDSWGRTFADNAAWQNLLDSYHLTHFVTISHRWQNGGLDNKLPDVLPANAELGGDAALRQWIKTALDAGGLFALHEDYVVFYPNAASYTEQALARDRKGQIVPAWKNVVQGYAVAPSEIVKYIRKFAPEIHKAFETNASFLDVQSGEPPWYHVDFQAGAPGAGTFRAVADTNRESWKLLRDTYNGPVLGEGGFHWYWSGLLDGVEAQFGQGVPVDQGVGAPLFVDFDLLKIHPLQFNHGMGYLERWADVGSGAAFRMPPVKTLDEYRMQEVAYGHGGFVPSQLTRNLPFIWQEYNLMRPTAAQYAEALPESILYDVDGKLVPAGEVVAAGAAFDRVRVRYDNGLSVWANGRAEEWRVGTDSAPVTLPQYGWLAQGKDLLAYTGLRDGVTVEYAETPSTLYVNARPESTGAGRTAPRLIDFGKAATDGSFLLERTAPGVWTLTPFPRTHPFTVAIDAARLDTALTRLRVEALDADDHALGAVTLAETPAGNSPWTKFQVNGIAKAVRYRLSAEN